MVLQRVGFQQVIASLGAARPVQEARLIYKGPLTLEVEPIEEMYTYILGAAEDRAGASHQAHACVVEEDRDHHVRFGRGRDGAALPPPPGGGGDCLPRSRMNPSPPS
jgi:hypothetical protein